MTTQQRYYSLWETCTRLGIDPAEYLTDVLVLVNTHPQSRIAELTPHGWASIKKYEEKRLARAHQGEEASGVIFLSDMIVNRSR